MRIGFDIDGVLTDADHALYRFIYYSLREKDPALYDILLSTYFNSLKPLHDPELFLSSDDEYYIITGRPSPRNDTVTRNWCRKHCPNNKGVYLVGKEGESSQYTIKAKAEKIKELGIQVYFDDDPRFVKYLRETLTDVTTIQIGGVQTIKSVQ
jgi:hypothetical protein